MNTPDAPQLPHRPAIIERWLRKHRLAEALDQFGSAAIFAFLGIIASVLLTFPFAWITDYEPVYCVTPFVLAMTFSLIRAYRNRLGNRFGIDWSSGDTNSLTGICSMLLQLLFAGPAMLISAYADVIRAESWLKMDVPEVSAVLLWIFQNGGKARVRELSTAFSHLNTVRIFPQLRDLLGVVWLLDNRGVILLTEDLQREFTALLGELPGFTQRQHTAAGADEAPKPSPHSVEVSAEVEAWYQALDLPAYAPMHEVRRRYRQLVKIHHPDVSKNRGKSSSASDDRIKQINLAYHNILKNTQSPNQ